MNDYDTIRRGLAEAMGYTYVPSLGDDWVIDPDGEQDLAPNPLGSAWCAERLEVWCVSQGWEVETQAEPEQCSVRIWRGPKIPGIISVYIHDHDEPDPAKRRRRALVECAWKAVQAAREAQP